MPVFHKQKLIFVHVPKTGGTYFESQVDGFSTSNKFNYINLFGYPSHVLLEEKSLYENFDVLGIQKISNIQKRAKEEFKKILKINNPCCQHLNYQDIAKCTVLV